MKRARGLNRRRQAGARPERRRETPSKEETAGLFSRANREEGGSGVSHQILKLGYDNKMASFSNEK